MRSRSEKGFTLIEMMIVIIIVALVTTGVALSFGATQRVKMRSSAWSLVAAVRYAYSHAVTQGETVRLVLGFSEEQDKPGQFYLESTKGRVVLTRESEDQEGLRENLDVDTDLSSPGLVSSQMDSIGSSLGGGNGAGGAGLGSGGMGILGLAAGSGVNMQDMASGSGMADMMSSVSSGSLADPFLSSMAGTSPMVMGSPAGYTRPKFKPLEGKKGEKRELQGSTRFLKIFTPHNPSAVEEGKAYIYFFPRGISEHSIIQVTNEDEIIYSIEIHPLTGRAKLHSFEVEPEEELEELQEADE